LESGGCDVLGDGVFEGGKGSPDGRRGGGLVGFEERCEEPVLEFGVEPEFRSS
jgi:hypothetical protein